MIWIAVVNAGFRSGLVVPLLNDNEIVGTITLARKQVQPFTDKQISYSGTSLRKPPLPWRDTRRERQYREMQSELAHANRVATMGQLTASIAHEIRQPIATARNNACAALNFLGRHPPDLSELKQALDCIVADADRAGDIIGRIGLSSKKSATPEGGRRPQCGDPGGDRPNPRRSGQDRRQGGHATAGELPCIQGDRVQLQQVMLT